MHASNRRRKTAAGYRAPSSLQLKGGLVLSRAVGEQIHIGEDIVITLVSTEGPKGEIHIHAPRDVKISRPEEPRRG